MNTSITRTIRSVVAAVAFVAVGIVGAAGNASAQTFTAPVLVQTDGVWRIRNDSQIPNDLRGAGNYDYVIASRSATRYLKSLVVADPVRNAGTWKATGAAYGIFREQVCKREFDNLRISGSVQSACVFGAAYDLVQKTIIEASDQGTCWAARVNRSNGETTWYPVTGYSAVYYCTN